MGSKKPDIHVQPDGDEWRVTRRGQKRAIAVTDTQAQAVERARPVAERDKTELSIHGRGGPSPRQAELRQ